VSGPVRDTKMAKIEAASGRKRKECCAHRQKDQELAPAALRFARSSLEAPPERRTDARGIASCRSRLGYTLERFHIQVARIQGRKSPPRSQYPISL
jgi:hypothetical protein